MASPITTAVVSGMVAGILFVLFRIYGCLLKIKDKLEEDDD